MVNTTKMLPGEYSHYVLRYSAIQSGFAEYNLTVRPEHQRDPITSILKKSYTDLFDILMERLESEKSDFRRGCMLSYFIEQIERFDFRHSLGVYGENVTSTKAKQKLRSERIEPLWRPWN